MSADIALLQQAGLAVCNDGEGYYLLATDQSIPVEPSAMQLASLLWAVRLVRKAVPASLRDDLEIAEELDIHEILQECTTTYGPVALRACPKTQGRRAVATSWPGCPIPLRRGMGWGQQTTLLSPSEGARMQLTKAAMPVLTTRPT